MFATIVVAYDEGRVIGNNGTIPWFIKEDLAHFKNVTMGSTVIMGRKTWDSLPDRFKPLPGRSNVVLTRNENLDDDRCYFQTDLEEAIDLISFGKVFIIGGAQIYQEAIDRNLVDTIIASEVKGKHDGDTFFPEINGWSSETLQEYEKFKVVKYVRNFGDKHI